MATLKLIKNTQNIGFVDELRELSKGKAVSANSKLFRLGPYLSTAMVSYALAVD